MAAASSSVIGSIPSLPVQFQTQLEEMFENIQALYPDCDKVRAVRREFDLLKKMGSAMLIRAWNENMEPFYDACAQRDALKIASGDLPILQRVGFLEKLSDPSIDGPTRQTMWEYIDVLNLMALKHFKKDAVYAKYYDEVHSTQQALDAVDDEIDTSADIDQEEKANLLLKNTLGMDLAGIQRVIPKKIYDSIQEEIEKLSTEEMSNMDITDPRFLKIIMDVNARAIAKASPEDREALEQASRRVRKNVDASHRANPRLIEELQSTLSSEEKPSKKFQRPKGRR